MHLDYLAGCNYWKASCIMKRLFSFIHEECNEALVLSETRDCRGKQLGGEIHNIFVVSEMTPEAHEVLVHAENTPGDH